MGKALLKISEEMFDAIEKGKKKFEVRKLNKDYIQEGDFILLVSLEEQREMEVVVTNKRHSSPQAVEGGMYGARHEETQQFVRDNYMDEFAIVVLNIEKYGDKT